MLVMLPGMALSDRCPHSSATLRLRVNRAGNAVRRPDNGASVTFAVTLAATHFVTLECPPPESGDTIQGHKVCEVGDPRIRPPHGDA